MRFPGPIGGPPASWRRRHRRWCRPSCLRSRPRSPPWSRPPWHQSTPLNPTPARCPTRRRWKPTRTPRPLSPASLRRRPCSSRRPLPRLQRAWTVYNIAAERDRLPEGTTQGAKTESLGHGINGYGHAHYDGPNPPRGHAAHHYRFRLMALDVEALGLGPKATIDEVRKEVGKHLLGEAELVGTYAR
nr:YbhB/YbcL family Raf kinase inhibitor-like protein [Azospirillum sp. 412522]